MVNWLLLLVFISFTLPVCVPNFNNLRLRGAGIPKPKEREFASWGTESNRRPDDFEVDIGAGRPLRDGMDDPVMDRWAADNPYDKPIEDEEKALMRSRGIDLPQHRMEVLKRIDKER
mmetsp:Transcript_12018/g.33297  ORF Transcript_12018/g.33297 Transcript_12018/m.33297 type:complete len:117 (-) Transcript_12018:47-397(-)